jgi:uncharacterized protein
MEQTMANRGEHIALYIKLGKLRTKYKVAWELLEQDYLLSWMLAGIAATPELKQSLIFKGGTALKKIYFGEYRFSQDLDFSITDPLPSDFDLDLLIGSACTRAMELNSTSGNTLYITHHSYREREPHPDNQKAFTISGQFQWHREPLTSIMIEITPLSAVLLPTLERPILHQEYDEILVGLLKVYQLEEIISEKIVAILHYSMKLHERGWARSRARDYYDLWSILTTYNRHLDVSILPGLVSQKCLTKNVHFSGPSDLFASNLMEDLENAWKLWLTPYVPFLPEKDAVLNRLRYELNLIWNKLPPQS